MTDLGLIVLVSRQQGGDEFVHRGITVYHLWKSRAFKNSAEAIPSKIYTDGYRNFYNYFFLHFSRVGHGERRSNGAVPFFTSLAARCFIF
jgi:hypothetical protein